MGKGEKIKTFARFIGRDGSCGLARMQIYRIEIIDNGPDAEHRYRLFVNGLGIPYDTMTGIRKNWKWPT